MPETQQSVKEPGSMDTALYGLEPLDRETFQDVVSLVYHKAGIKLGPQKEALVSARLARRMRQLGIRRYSEYYRRVHDDTTVPNWSKCSTASPPT